VRETSKRGPLLAPEPSCPRWREEILTGGNIDTNTVDDFAHIPDLQQRYAAFARVEKKADWKLMR